MLELSAAAPEREALNRGLGCRPQAVPALAALAEADRAPAADPLACADGHSHDHDREI